MESVRIGIIGCGSVAHVAHLPAIAKSRKLVLGALHSRSRNSAERVSVKWGPVPIFDSVEDLAASGLVDAVIIASPNAYHFEHASAALQAGLHVYIEKPMTSTNTEAWALVRLSRERELRLTVGSHQRFWTQHRWARDLIEEGAIGQVRLVRSSLHETWHLYQENVAQSDYRLHPGEAVAGTIFDQGSHRVDLLAYLAQSRPRRVVGIARNVASPELGPFIDDLAIAVIEYENGAHGVLTTDKFSPVVSNVTEVYGTAGMMFASSEAMNPFQTVPLAVYSAREYDWDSLPDVLRQYRYPDAFWVDDLVKPTLTPRWVSVVPPRNDPFRAILEDFASAIVDGRDPAISPEDGAFAMEVLLGVLRSAETGGWADLPLEGEQVPPALLTA